MGSDTDIARSLETLDQRLKAILPEVYQDSYETVQPVSMGSAGLKFDDTGNVAWDEIWGSFCDLAMAGGPPHKGSLLEPGSSMAIAADPDRYQQVADEICRGVMMAVQLDAQPSPVPGWVRVECYSSTMADWLRRAITTENVAARAAAQMIDLPAAPHFRLEKEIKNVITVTAKTSHYWLEHMSFVQHRRVTSLFAQMADELPLIEPAFSPQTGYVEDDATRSAMADAIGRLTGLRPSSQRAPGWLGLECPSVPAAVWMMRALVVSNVLSRREGTTLFVPVNATSDPDGTRVIESVASVYRLAAAKDVL